MSRHRPRNQEAPPWRGGPSRVADLLTLEVRGERIADGEYREAWRLDSIDHDARYGQCEERTAGHCNRSPEAVEAFGPRCDDCPELVGRRSVTRTLRMRVVSQDGSSDAG